MPFAGAYLLTVIVYSYFFTTLIFTDHTFPNVFIFDFPSYQTTSEGRWFGDIICWLVGGSGVQPLQIALATGLQITNAFLFVTVLQVHNRFYLFLAAAFVALHPAFLDYYSYSIEHLPLTLGDTMALLGIVALDRTPSRRLGVALGILCFVLTLAVYQPKIALVALLLLIWCLQGTSLLPARGSADSRTMRPVSRLLISRILLAACTFVAALGLYYVSAKLVVTVKSGKTEINDLHEMLQALLRAYPETLANFTTRVDYVPRVARFVPFLGIVLGIAAVMRRAWNIHKGFAVYALVLIALFPAALQLSFIINKFTWQNAGRSLSPHAYGLLFFLASAWSLPKWRQLPTVLVAILVYSFGILGSQAANSAALKNVFDVAKVNRIVARVESVAPDLYRQQLPMVIIGELDLEPEGRLRKFANRLYGANVITNEAFVYYRQPELLNFFLGHTAVVRPNKLQVDAALASLPGRRPWPAPEAVYMHDGVIVVLLQSYSPSIPITGPVPLGPTGVDPILGRPHSP
jgi:hypothetical protein